MRSRGRKVRQRLLAESRSAGLPLAVPPDAVARARGIIDQMLKYRPNVATVLVKAHARVAIMAESERTMDLPQQRDWKKPAIDDPALTFCERKHYAERIGRLSDRDYWNNRPQGMGGLLTGGAAENIMGKPGTRYYGENIFVHESSHEIMSGVAVADSALYGILAGMYGGRHRLTADVFYRSPARIPPGGPPTSTAEAC